MRHEEITSEKIKIKKAEISVFFLLQIGPFLISEFPLLTCLKTLMTKRKTTHGTVALLKDLMRQQFQGATIDTRFCSEVALDGVIGFSTVGGSSMEDHLPVDGSSLRVPDVHTNT